MTLFNYYDLYGEVIYFGESRNEILYQIRSTLPIIGVDLMK